MECEIVALDVAGQLMRHFLGTVNAEAVALGGRTFAPETLAVVYIEPVPMLTSVRYQLRAAVCPEDRPTWNHLRRLDGLWDRVVDASGSPMYPVKAFPPESALASTGSST